MRGSNAFRDNEPLAHLGRWPIYVATLLAVAHVLGMILVGVKLGGQFGGILKLFNPESMVKGGQWWIPLTYPFVGEFTIFSALGAYCFYLAAVEIEKFYGRVRVLKLYVNLVLLPVVLATIFWLMGANAQAVQLQGAGMISLGFLVALACVYPNIEMFGGITPKTIAIFFVALACVMAAAKKDMLGVVLILASCGFAQYYVHRMRAGNDSVGFGQLFQGWKGLRRPRKPQLVLLPKPVRREMPKAEMADPADDTEVDALLDKIAKSGIASLSSAEKARLERAREELLKKDRQ